MKEIIGISLFLGLLTVKFIYLIDSAQAFFSGSSIDERKAAYISNQGKKWESSFPAAMKQGLFAWLEAEKSGGLPSYSWNGKNRPQLISEEIDYLTRDDDCRARGGNFWWPWKNCWWTGDHPTPLIVSRVLYQYGNILSAADRQKIKDRLRGIASYPPGVWCANYNYHVAYLIPSYLYVYLADDIGSVFYDKPDPVYRCPPTFTVDGRTYVGGNSYPAKEIYRDYLYYTLNEWQKRGTPEDLSTSYYEIPTMAIALLADFAPDAEMRKRAKMHLDWLLFNYAVSFSANAPSGGSGRTYTDQHLAGRYWFPWTIFYRFDQPMIDKITESRVFTDHYVSSYRHPSLFTEIFESINGPNRNEGDDYYRVVRGHVPDMGGASWWDEQLGILNSAYRYAYVTPNYNLGGTGFGTGWELNILGNDTPLKLWINDCPVTVPDKNQCGTAGNGELTALSPYGYQHRNAIFVNGGGSVKVVLGGNSWDEQSTESGWQFFRKGKVAVAAGVQGSQGALEVATLGVDYGIYNDFKTAIKNNTSISSAGYRTSKGIMITPGYVDYGPEFSKLPFDRLEVWEGHVGVNNEVKIVVWNNNVMSVSWMGRNCKYDFNSWTTFGNACDAGGPTSTPTPGTIKGDLDGDGNVDIFDYNILVENFGKTDCGNAADIDGNCKVDIFDYNILVENFGKKI